jgi:hypothetical protein
MTKVFDGIIIHTERVMNGNERRLDVEPQKEKQEKKNSKIKWPSAMLVS